MNESYTIELLAGIDGSWGYRIIRTHVIDEETRITDTIAFEYPLYHSKKAVLEGASNVLTEWMWKQ